METRFDTQVAIFFSYLHTGWRFHFLLYGGTAETANLI